MDYFVILATGQSLCVRDVEHVRTAREAGKCKVIAVSNSYTVAPWADVLASVDLKWWANYRQALKFEGEKICKSEYARVVKQFRPPELLAGCNSGLYAMLKAKHMGASSIFLLGFDMQGTHFFGKHPEPLNNTTSARFQQHINQFNKWDGPKVINCTPGSALKKFEMGRIQDIL